MGGELELRAPRDSGQSLIVPSTSRVAELLEATDHDRQSTGAVLGDRTIAQLVNQSRSEVVQRALAYTSGYRSLPPLENPLPQRVLLAGHQPELFHSGVWFKNFVLDALARQHRAVAVNLVIDSDVLKGVSLRVPGGTVDRPTLSTIPFDQPTEELPYEERQVLDRPLFTSFANRVADEIGSLVPEPLLMRLWPTVLERLDTTGNLGLAMAQARHQLEGEWGLVTLELPQSQVCQLSTFHWFTAHLLAHAPRFWQAHNTALAEYRQVHHLRSKTHPVPDLGSGEMGLEAPLWVWSAENPRRRKVFVRERNGRLVVGDEAGWEMALDLEPAGSLGQASEQLASLAQEGRVKLRTRALSTTLFARLLLGDLFLHGIGGVKYDEVTNRIIERFYGCPAPPFLAATATVHLPIPTGGRPAANGPCATQLLRELRFHPERHLDPLVPREAEERRWLEEKIATKGHWIATPKTRENAHERHQAITQANADLQPFLAERRDTLLQESARRDEQARIRAILDSREYSFCLFPETRLRDFMFQMLADHRLSRAYILNI